VEHFAATPQTLQHFIASQRVSARRFLFCRQCRQQSDLNNSSRFLYLLAVGSQAVIAFRVNQDGALTMIDPDGGLPLGAQGIAAK